MTARSSSSVTSANPAELFHPAVAGWFMGRFASPTSAQDGAWPAAQRGEDVLLAAPTGSGKTLAAFLVAIDALVREGTAGTLPDETRVLYVSPLRALSNDVQKNLLVPLAGIREALAALTAGDVQIQTAVRTGDTSQKDRTRATGKPPHLYVTTPESFYILLTSESGRRMLKTVRTVIVDEIHALVGDKRGSHLALSLERLDALTGRKVQRIGLSATQKPIEDVARFLVGAGRLAEDGTPRCTIVDTGHVRARDLAVEIPESPLEAVMSGEVWEEVYDRIAALVGEHKTTLVFVNTRRLCERLAKNLGDRLGAERVTSHHGSLSREHRLLAEQRLKSGELKALVATASLELGIDVGDVDLVVQVGATRSIAAFVQRVGRSGHFLGGVPKGRLFPLSRDELVEAAALVDAVRRGELDRVRIPEAPLDILAQQIVAATAAEGEWTEDDLYALVRRAYPYRDLSRARFDEVVGMVARGFATARGRRGAHLHQDTVEHKLRPRRGARLTAITSGGAIPDVADYEVLLEPESVRVGSIHEDFAIESMAGDVFQLGNQSYVIRRVEPGRVRVEDARGATPTIPFWLGEAPARSTELSHSLSRLRQDVSDQLDRGDAPAAGRWLTTELGLSEPAATQIADYLALGRAALGTMPTEDQLVLERFFDETGGMHLVIHAPFGGRINRAWGLALRKSFCRKFDFELQAAANEDAIVLSLGPTHSFAVEDVWSYLKSKTARDVLIQALLVAPVFGTRFRWNAQRALAVLRFRGGKKVPPRFQRMDADDLLTVCFPDQVACAENLVGEREIPDHPLVQQTVDDATTEAMDADGLVRLLERIEKHEVGLVARDLTEPSPFAAGILTAKPYAFLDDAPLEERRTQAVLGRRWLDREQAKDLGALDPEAIRRVCEDAWPDPRDADELVDMLGVLGFVTESEGRASGLESLFLELRNARRATRLDVNGGLWVAADRLAEHLAVHPEAPPDPRLEPSGTTAVPSREDALREILRSRLEGIGPVTAAEIATSLAVPRPDVDVALALLENEGVIFRGSYRKESAGAVEWCERRLLARIHRMTIDRLRSEIEPVTQQDFVRFLLSWQRVDSPDKLEGPTGVRAALDLLEGFEAPAGSWEADLLAARVDHYDPSFLDALCLSGHSTWLRRTPSTSGSTPVRTTPIALVPRSSVERWLALAPQNTEPAPLSHDATRVRDALARHGASFFEDIVRGSGLLRTQVEVALGELVSRGLVGSDGFSGLRALLVPASKRRETEHGRRRGRPTYGLETAGRWSLLASPALGTAPTPERAPGLDDEELEAVARSLLRRWGVVFRRVIDREGALPPWRDLLRCYRRLEARGEIRGGRFVSGFSGEQYALPDAVTALRAARKRPKTGTLIAVSAADPLNVVGILTPGARVPSLAGNRVLYRDGVPVAAREGAETRVIGTPDVAEPELEAALIRRPLSPGVRAYLGSAGPSASLARPRGRRVLPSEERSLLKS
jgi:ATP-dependent Lhr-like helicase